MLTYRLKILKCNTTFFLALLKSGSRDPVKIINPLPKDATITRIFQDNMLGNLNMVIASESFPELKEGDEIPLITMPLFELLLDGNK